MYVCIYHIKSTYTQDKPEYSIRFGLIHTSRHEAQNGDKTIFTRFPI